MKIIISLSILSLLLMGCVTNKHLIKLKEQEKAGTVEFKELNHVNVSDTYLNVLGSLGATAGGNARINLGVRAMYQPIRLGSLEATAIQHLLPYKGYVSNEASRSSAMKNRFNLSYELPILKYKSTRETVVPLYDNNTGNPFYYTIMDVDYLNVWGLRASFGHNYYSTTTLAYGNSITAQYDEVFFDHAFNRGDMFMQHGAVVAKMGFSYSMLFGTTLNAVNSKHNFVGSLFRKLSFYGELQYLLYAQTDAIEMTYSYYDNTTFSSVQVTELVEPKDIVKKRSIGFAVGANYTLWSTPVSNFTLGGSLEVGATPGYFDEFSQGIYVELGLNIGFGKVKKRFKTEVNRLLPR